MPNVINDVHGQFNALVKLIEKMPSDDIVMVGDCIDRGSASNLVIEFAKSTPNVRLLMGDHEDMMLDYFDHLEDQRSHYDDSLWMINGGRATLNSYGFNGIYNPKVPKEHLDFLRSLPLYIETDTCFISHAPWSAHLDLDKACNPTWSEDSIVWNRMKPIKRDKFQIFGHNSHWGLRKFWDWGICIDTSQSEILTGINTETKEIFQQKYC